MSLLEKIILGALLAPWVLLAAAIVIEDVIDRWDAPEYPYSGFCPDFPTWEPSWETSDEDL